MNRRRFMIGTGAMLIGPSLCELSAEESPSLAFRGSEASAACSYDTRLPDMLVSYLVKELNRLASEWDRKRALLKTAADVQARNKFVREKTIQMLHGFPERNPLGAVTVKVIEKNGYRIENVMFQSRPNFWVTGNLYIPTHGEGPFPGIISPCGHYPLGRMQPTYQTVYLNLVKSGFVVLGYDPIGQGERRQYWNPKTDVTEVSEEPTYEHSMPGLLLLLMGENLSEYFIWDGMRAIDYLLTRPEVDPKKIGCAGHSGGGTLTKFISAVDERVQCAAIMEGGTANRWPMKIMPWQPFGVGDMEQDLFPAALYGIDNVDLQTAIGPRPLLVGIEHYGEAFDRAAQAIRYRYQQLGVPERFATVASDDPHSWTSKLRLATTDWFCRWFYNKKGPLTEPSFELEAPEALYCTPEGSIRYSGKGQTIFSLIARKGAELPPGISPPSGSAESAAYQHHMREKLTQLLHYKKSNQPLDTCLTVTTPRNGYRIEKLQFLSESDIYVSTWVYVPEATTGKLPVILYVSDAGVAGEGMEFEGHESVGLVPGMFQTLALAGNLVVAIDVRGIGETRPEHTERSPDGGKFHHLFDLETAMSDLAWFMDRSLLGMRVQDVVRSVDYVMTRHDADQDHIHLIGKGMGGLWSLFAAVLDSRIKSLISVESLLSYRCLTQVDRYLYGGDVFILDVLLHCDLPQVAASLCGRPLALIHLQDPMKRTVGQSIAEQAYKFTKATYEAAGLHNFFTIASEGRDLETPQHYLSLIRTFNSYLGETKASTAVS